MVPVIAEKTCDIISRLEERSIYGIYGRCKTWSLSFQPCELWRSTHRDTPTVILRFFGNQVNYKSVSSMQFIIPILFIFTSIGCIQDSF